MRDLSTTLHVARHRLWNVQAWLWFVEIPFGGGVFRLVRNARHVQANTVKWQACEFALELPAESGDGALGEILVGVPNVSRVPMLYVEAEDELLGRELTVYLQHESSLESFSPDLSWTSTIIDCPATERTLTMRCGHGASSLRIPSRICTRREFPQLLRGAGAGLGSVFG